MNTAIRKLQESFSGFGLNIQLEPIDETTSADQEAEDKSDVVNFVVLMVLCLCMLAAGTFGRIWYKRHDEKETEVIKQLTGVYDVEQPRVPQSVTADYHYSDTPLKHVRVPPAAAFEMAYSGSRPSARHFVSYTARPCNHVVID
jgi:hypothetical protein